MGNRDTIDITDLVDKTRSAFVDWAVLYLFGLEITIPGMEWVGLPVIKDIDQAIIRLIIETLSKSAIMQAFFLNTALRKATQAGDFVKTSEDLEKLPDNVTDEEYEKYEKARMDAFRNFVSLTS